MASDPAAHRAAVPSSARALALPPSAGKDRRRFSRCINPARTAEGSLRPCRSCTACAYAVQSEKVRLLAAELDPLLPSYFVTATFTDAQAIEDCILPAKPEGALTEEQHGLARRWESRIAELEALAESCERGDERRAASLRRRRRYREKRLDEFMQKATEFQPARLSVSRKAGKLWQKRIKDTCARLDPPQPPPRMVLKHEYGSNTHRPHIHAMVLSPTDEQLRVVVETWGRMWASPQKLKAWDECREPAPCPGWRTLSQLPVGRGHVQVQPVTDEKIGAYVSKDLYRGQDARAFEYIAKALPPPCIIWPRNPGMGCGGWREYLERVWREYHGRYRYTPVDVELCIQDTRNKRTSLRHRMSHATFDRRPGSDGAARVHHHKCPDSVWRAFYQEVIEPWRASDPEHEKARDLVYRALREEDRAEADAVGYASEQRHRALNAARKRLSNWRALRRRKGLGPSTYAEAEEEYIARKQAELRGGQIAAAVVSAE